VVAEPLGLRKICLCCLVDQGLTSDDREEFLLWVTNMPRILLRHEPFSSKCQRETDFVSDMSNGRASVAVYVTWGIYLQGPPAIRDCIPLWITETHVPRLNYRAWSPEIGRLQEEQLHDVSGRFLLPDHRPDPHHVAAPQGELDMAPGSQWM